MNQHISYVESLEQKIRELKEEVLELRAKLNVPELEDFAKGVVLEAVHQRDRWGSTHDAGKTAADWFWLIGYLAQKVLYSADNNLDRAKHHCVSCAAALANWHAQLAGDNHEMRPGLGAEAITPVQSANRIEELEEAVKDGRKLVLQLEQKLGWKHLARCKQHHIPLLLASCRCYAVVHHRYYDETGEPRPHSLTEEQAWEELEAPL